MQIKFSLKKFCNILMKKQLSLTEVSRLSGIDISSISKYSNGKMKPGTKNIRKIAEALKVDVDEIIE